MTTLILDRAKRKTRSAQLVYPAGYFPTARLPLSYSARIWATMFSVSGIRSMTTRSKLSAGRWKPSIPNSRSIIPIEVAGIPFARKGTESVPTGPSNGLISCSKWFTAAATASFKTDVARYSGMGPPPNLFHVMYGPSCQHHSRLRAITRKGHS